MSVAVRDRPQCTCSCTCRWSSFKSLNGIPVGVPVCQATHLGSVFSVLFSRCSGCSSSPQGPPTSIRAATIDRRILVEQPTGTADIHPSSHYRPPHTPSWQMPNSPPGPKEYDWDVPILFSQHVSGCSSSPQGPPTSIRTPSTDSHIHHPGRCRTARPDRRSTIETFQFCSRTMCQGVHAVSACVVHGGCYVSGGRPRPIFDYRP